VPSQWSPEQATGTGSEDHQPILDRQYFEAAQWRSIPKDLRE